MEISEVIKEASSNWRILYMSPGRLFQNGSWEKVYLMKHH